MQKKKEQTKGKCAVETQIHGCVSNKEKKGREKTAVTLERT
jgi:hypothetical protein